MFTVDLFDRAYSTVQTAGLTLTPGFYSARAWGGPERAEILVSGDSTALWAAVNWLRYWVVIRNSLGNPVWWGYVNNVAVGMGAVEAGRTLDQMANRVIVDYSSDSEEGGQERGTTAWAQDAWSVGMYGEKEERLSASDATLAEAQALRDTTLAKRGRPIATMEMTESSGARLDCIGLWQTLEWQLYANTMGREDHDVTTDIEHMVGWAISDSTNIGFRANRIDDLLARLAAVLPQNQVRVEGSTTNDGAYTITSPGDEDSTAITYVSDEIQFERFDDIQDNNLGLAVFKLGYMIHTSGSGQTENSGAFWVTTEDDYRIEVTPATIVDENELGNITIKQGHGLTVDEGLVLEKSGATVTLTGIGYKLAQKFQLASGTGWTVREIRVRARKVGAPTDNLRASIYSVAAGVPNVQLATATVALTGLTPTMAWRSFDLGAGVALAAATDYFLVVERTGAADYDDFPVVGLEGAKTYARGDLIVYDHDAAVWATRSPDAHMPFILRDSIETSSQISTMLDGAQFVGVVDMKQASGVYTNQLRNGDLSIRTEVEKLLATGTSTGGGLVAYVMRDRTVVVDAEAVSTSENLFLSPDGRLMEPVRGAAEEGLLPVGKWVTIEGAPSVLEDVATFYVEKAEYDVTGGRLRLEPRAHD